MDPNRHPMFKRPRLFLTKDADHRWLVWLSYSPPLRGNACWYVRGGRSYGIQLNEDEEQVGRDAPWDEQLYEWAHDKWVLIPGENGDRK